MSARMRDASESDAPAIRALLEEHALVSFGEPELSEEEVRSWFRLPKLWIQVAERDGSLVGYVDARSEDGGRFDVDARTLDPQVAPSLVQAAERHAGEQSLLRGYVQGEDPTLRQAFEAAGWRPIRHSFQMRIDLDGHVAEPVWPDELEPRNVEPGEEERVYEAHMDSFADHWDFRRESYEEWSRYSLDRARFDPSLWWLVEDGDELAAITLNTWHSSGDLQYGWIHVLGVRPRWRKRGLATALLRHSFRDFEQRGATRVGLGVDGENTTGAVRLYEKAGMRQVRRNDTYEKTL